MADPEPRWIPTDIAGRTFQRINLRYGEVGARIVEEIESDVDVYYDRRWPLTREFCAFLMERPEIVRARTVFAAGAGVGMEAVVLGHLADALVLNDVAPVALELAAEQLERNGIEGFRVDPGPFQDADMSGIDLVVACFVVYDAETRDAMAALLERAGRRELPALLANEDLGGFFTEFLDGLEPPVRELDPEGKGRIVMVG